MIRTLAPLIPVFLAACAPAPPAPVAVLDHDGATYEISAGADGQWSVRVDGTRILCATATRESCSWAVRHHLNAQDALDDLG